MKIIGTGRAHPATVVTNAGNTKSDIAISDAEPPYFSILFMQKNGIFENTVEISLSRQAFIS